METTIERSPGASTDDEAQSKSGIDSRLFSPEPPFLRKASTDLGMRLCGRLGVGLNCSSQYLI